MPKFYKQNKKKRNPRYFLNESTLSESNEILDEIKNKAKLVCENQSAFLQAIKLLQSETTTDVVMNKSKCPEALRSIVESLIVAYRSDKTIQKSAKSAVDVLGEATSDSPAEYLSAQGQAPFTDGNMRTSVAAAKRRAIKALRAKGAKGPVKFYKPHPKSGYLRGDKVVVTAYVGEAELDSYGKPEDDSRFGYSPTDRARKEGEKFLEKVKNNPGYKDNEYVQDMESWFGTPEKWHSFLTGAKALDKAPKAQQEYSRLSADLKQVQDTARRARGQGETRNWFDDLRDWASGSRTNREAKWAFAKAKEIMAQMKKLKVAAGLASKVGYRVGLFSRGKDNLPGEEERDVRKSAELAAKGKKAELTSKVRPGMGYNIKRCRILKRCRCLSKKIRFPGASKMRRWPGVEKVGEENRKLMDKKMQEILKMLSVVISKEEVNKPNTRGALIGLTNDALNRWPYSCQQSTMKLIAKFQKGHGLTCDGCVGTGTYKKLKQVYDETMNA